MADIASNIEEASIWVEDNKASIPEAVFLVVTLAQKLRSELDVSRAKAANLLQLFRQSLGISPKSEAGKKIKAPPKTDAEKLEAAKKSRQKLNKKIRAYQARLNRANGSKPKNKPDSKDKAEKSALKPLQPSEETVFSGRLAEQVDQTEPKKVDKAKLFENPVGLHSSSDERKRHEYTVQTSTTTYSVETVTDPRTGKTVTASMDDVGPPNSQATWEAIASTIISVVGYAIPANRLSTMLCQSNSYFTTSRLLSFLKLAADMFLPIYNCLGEQLSDSDLLQGDDTSANVVEMKNELASSGELKQVEGDSPIAVVANLFGRLFPKKNGKGNKRAVNVSMLTGKTNPDDRRSRIFFFRTHVGSLGNLLTKILEMRDPKKKKVTIHSDLSSSNWVSTAISAKFSITIAGCAAHARRPFWRHKDKDESLCYWMLSAFLVLESIENTIDEKGRTWENTLRYRKKYSTKVWQAMLVRCNSVLAGETTYADRWPKTSEIYKACKYIQSNYERLTAYIDDPRLSSTNNLSERILRWDKIMQDASKFRKTEAGRLNIDILRTILQTCSAAEIDIRDYLVFVFKHRKEIENSPELYTPYAYALSLD